MLAPYADSYTGLDQNDKVLTAARKRLSAFDQVRVLRSDMHALPFDDASFDSVLLLHVLTYAQDPDQVLRETKRVLRPGGRLAIATLGRHAHHALTEGYGHVNTGFDATELRDMLTGLTVQRCEVTSRERRKPHFDVITAFATKPKASVS